MIFPAPFPILFLFPMSVSVCILIDDILVHKLATSFEKAVALQAESVYIVPSFLPFAFSDCILALETHIFQWFIDHQWKCKVFILPRNETVQTNGNNRLPFSHYIVSTSHEDGSNVSIIPSDSPSEEDNEFFALAGAAVSSTPKEWKEGVIGGTFDHIHAGHLLMLVAACHSVTEKLHIGVTGEELLKNKKYAEQLQTMNERMEQVERIVKSQNPAIALEIFPLDNPFGPTLDSETIGVIVVSEETLPFTNEKINKTRVENNKAPLAIITAPLLSPPQELKEAGKLSSTHFQHVGMFHEISGLKKLLCNNLAPHQSKHLTSPLYRLIKEIHKERVSARDVFTPAYFQKKSIAEMNAYMPDNFPAEDYYATVLDGYSTPMGIKSPFHGIPFAVKDNFCSTVPTGQSTTAGSKMLENYISPYNATVVDRIMQHGGTIMGKTTLDEFGMGSTTSHCALSPPAMNPWSLLMPEGSEKLSAGGSSGGSAVAVASYAAFAALGSDTGGSVRQPAAWNGIVGLKPSYGTLSRFGMIAYGSSLDCPGLFTRNVADCAYVLDHLSGEDKNDNCTIGTKPTTVAGAVEKITARRTHSFVKENGKPIRVGLPKEYWVNELGEETVEMWKDTAALMEEAGAEIVECSLPHTKFALPVYLIIANAEASSNLARYDGVRYGYRSDNTESTSRMVGTSRKEGLMDEVQRRIIMGTFALSRDSYETFFLRAQLVRRLIKEDFDRCFQEENIDVMLSPTVPTTAKTLSQCKDEDPITEYMNDLMTIPANLAGIPALSLPGGLANNQLPIGMQLMAPHGKDADLLIYSALLENAIFRKNKIEDHW